MRMSDGPTPLANSAAQGGLARSLGLWHAAASNMVTMVGIGPFITIPLIVSAMGGPQAMLGWVLGALIAICDGQVWAELSTAIPGEGGSYAYLIEAYKRYVGKLVAFLFIRTFLLCGPFEIASGIVGMVNYIAYLAPHWTDVHFRLTAFGIGIVTIVLHYNRIRFVGAMTIALWVVMIITVVGTVVAGLMHIQIANALAFPPGRLNLSWGFVYVLGSATLIAMYDLMGYYNVCYVGEEVRNPGYVFPRAILWSVIIVSLLYALMNFVILGSLPWREIAVSRHIVTDIFQRYFGTTPAIVISIFVAFTAYGSVYALMMSYSRLPFVAARDGFFFRGMAAVHLRRHFPHNSLLLVGAMTAVACLFDLEFIIAATVSSRILIQFIGQIVGLTLLRRSRPDLHRPFRMWLYPVPSVIAFIGFAYIFISSGVSTIALGLAWLLVGVVLYIVWARSHREWPFGSLEIPIAAGTPE